MPEYLDVGTEFSVDLPFINSCTKPLDVLTGVGIGRHNGTDVDNEYGSDATVDSHGSDRASDTDACLDLGLKLDLH